MDNPTAMYTVYPYVYIYICLFNVYTNHHENSEASDDSLVLLLKINNNNNNKDMFHEN